MILESEGEAACPVRSGMVLAAGRAGAGAAGGVGEGGDAEMDGLAAAGGDLLHLGELGAGAGEADFQSFGLSEPAVGLGFGDPGGEVVADLDEAGAGGWVGAQERAAQAALTEMILKGSARPEGFIAHGR